jgi:lipoprotein-releasing system permease protein
MNVAYYLAKKIRFTKNQAFSSVIIKVGIASVAIAVSVLILSFFVLYGFKNTIKSKLFGQTSHIQISKITLNRSFEETSMPNNLEREQKTRNLPNIKSINKIALKSVILKSEDAIAGVVFKGIDKNYDWSEFKENLIAGRLPDFGKDSVSKEIIVSQKILNDLDLKLNDDLLVYFIQNPPRARKLKIVGIYNTNVEELDQLYFYGDINQVRKINNWDEGQFGHYEIYLKDISLIEETKESLLEIFPQEYEVLKVTEILPQFFDWFKLLDRNIILVIFLILIVAGFNMISVLLIMIMERTPMVGLLKSIGSTDGTIRSIFLSNGGRITFKGLIFGNLIAFSLAFIQSKFHIIKLDASNYYMEYVPIEWNGWVVLLVNISIFLVILLITFIPAMIIKKISPVQALKYKD